MKNFSSVSTNAARFQDISLNPQKLAGMCAKLKCCLNYEVDNYMEASKQFPAKDITLETIDSEYFYFKSDILAGLVTYSTDKRLAANLETASLSTCWPERASRDSTVPRKRRRKTRPARTSRMPRRHKARRVILHSVSKTARKMPRAENSGNPRTATTTAAVRNSGKTMRTALSGMKKTRERRHETLAHNGFYSLADGNGHDGMHRRCGLRPL